MANSLVRFLGFETGDLSEVNAVTTGSGNTVAVSTAQVNAQAPSAYSCHVKSTNSGANASFNISPLNADGTLNTTNANLTTPFLRGYFYLVTVTNTAGNGLQLTPLIRFINSSGNAVTECFLYVNSSKQLVLLDVGGTYHTGTTVLSLNTWYRLDLTINTSTGTWAVRINDSTELSGSHSGAATIYQIQIGGQSSANFEFYVDDLWLDSLAYPPDGGCAVFTANSNGFYTAWSGTASNAIPPSATGALTDSTSGDIRTVEISPNIAGGASVNAIKSLAYVKAASLGNSLAVHLRSGTSDNDTSGATNLSTTGYTLLEKGFLTDPATSLPWTISGANAAQPGVKNVTAGSGTSSCEAIYLMADFVGTTGPSSALLIPPFTYRRRFEPAIFE